MFGKLFHSCRDESGKKSSSPALLKQTLERFKEKESLLQKKIDTEAARAKEYTKARQKEAAMQCLKRKKFYEAQMQKLGKHLSQIQDTEQKLQAKAQTV